tara:strand:+ start:136 stop:519 length:384 start_codon:yes stop_codon:yes gene_type:complete
MTRDYRTGIKGILSLGPTPRKPRIIKSEPDPYEDVFSPDAPVVLTPGVNSTATPKDKFGNTKAQKDKMIEKYVVRPKAKSMGVVKYIDTINRLYGNSEERYNDRIQEQDLESRKARNNKITKEKKDG